MKSSDYIHIREVGPRDGLQNEAARVPTVAKIEFIQMLLDAGAPYVEATSMVRHDVIPQLNDAEEVVAAFPNDKRIAVLVPNLRGYARAINSGVMWIAMFVAASERFNKANGGKKISKTMDDIRAIAADAHKRGIRTRCYISTAFNCPFKGTIYPSEVRPIISRLTRYGIEEIVLADTTGDATPDQVVHLIQHTDHVVDTGKRIAMHFHDTFGNAMENIAAAHRQGIRHFDGSVGGLGGCPFAPGAPGNIATEQITKTYETGLDTSLLEAASDKIHNWL
jgi:hydroxymethylglutaryl-CoA lyase